MAEEIRKSEVKEFHMKVAQSLRAEPEIIWWPVRMICTICS